jgi:hypothetical protein
MTSIKTNPNSAKGPDKRKIVKEHFISIKHRIWATFKGKGHGLNKLA